MPDATTPTKPLPPADPSTILMNLIVALLAPMFLGVSAGNSGLARSAAIATINGYRTRNHADLIAVAQIIAFGLAALGSLSLSMADDVSLSMTLRLRGNANALNRSAEQNRRAVIINDTAAAIPYQAAEPDAPTTWQATATSAFPPEPPVFLSPQAAQLLAAEAEARLQEPRPTVNSAPVAPAVIAVTPNAKVPDQRNQQMWANAIVEQASTISAGIANLPPAKRETASLRVAALNSTAHQLLTASSPMDPYPGPPGQV